MSKKSKISEEEEISAFFSSKEEEREDKEEGKKEEKEENKKSEPTPKPTPLKKVKKERAPRNFPPADGKVLSFKAWFKNASLQYKKLKPYKFDEIYTFFKAEGLSDRELVERYEKVLKRYFGE